MQTNSLILKTIFAQKVHSMGGIAEAIGHLIAWLLISSFFAALFLLQSFLLRDIKWLQGQGYAEDPRRVFQVSDKCAVD